MKTIKVTKTIEVEENRATITDFIDFLGGNGELEVAAGHCANYALQEKMFLEHPEFSYYNPIEAMLRADSSGLVGTAMEDLFDWDETAEGYNHWNTISELWRRWLDEHKIDHKSQFCFE